MKIINFVYLSNLFVIVLGKDYLVTLKENGSVQNFLSSAMDNNHSVKELLSKKISKDFSIGSLRGFNMDLTKEYLQKLKDNPLVKEVIPNFKINAVGIIHERDEMRKHTPYDYEHNEDEDTYDRDKQDKKENRYDGNKGNYDDIFNFQTDAPRHLARISRRDALPFDFKDEDLYKNSFNYYYRKGHQGENVRAYILDSGIFRDHNEFEGRVEMGENLTEEESADQNGHGTHVAGIVGSKTFGVAKNITLIDVKCLNAGGSGNLVQVLKGLEFTVNDCKKHPDKKCVANLSLGSLFINILNEAVNEAVRSGVVVTVAAGNMNIDACFSSPSSSQGAITVGAFDDRLDMIAKFSNWGRCVDIFAPGVSILSTMNAPFPTHMLLSGTSMASPIVCGLVALLLEDGVEENDMKDKLIELATDDIFPRRSLIFKPKTPNRILFNGVDKEDDILENYTYPDLDMDMLLDDIYNYDGIQNQTAQDNNFLNLNNDVMLPTGKYNGRRILEPSILKIRR